MPINRDRVLAALKTVKEPELFKDIITLNMVKDIRIDGNHVQVQVELKAAGGPMKDTIQRDIDRAVRAAGAESVKVEFGGKTPSVVSSGPKKDVLPQVKNVIAVGAGKGGVGKSTLALNIAVGLQRQGAQVGLMDGDIYGPSMPTMLGIKGRAPQSRDSKFLPFYVHGIHAITIGMLVEQDKPLIWRGPMAHGAFKQLFLDTAWPELDYLVVDLPPGTGDVSLTLCQLLPITGAIVVATPQQVALDDAVRAARMFQQLGAPVLGVVENMSYFVGPDGSEQDIFGRGGAERMARQLQLPYLGELPMFRELRVNSDAGEPELNFTENPKLAAALERIVQAVSAEVSKKNQQVGLPKLNII